MKEFVTLATLWFILACLTGMLSHTAKKAMRGELGIPSNPFQLRFYSALHNFLFVDQPGYTVAAFFTCIAACFAIVAAGQIETLATHIVVALGFTTGWTCNSGINTGATPSEPPQ